MRVITANESRIRTTEHTIRTGGSAVRHVKDFTVGIGKRTRSSINTFEGEYSVPDKSEEENFDNLPENMPELGSVMTEEGKILYKSLSKSQRKKFNKMYEKEISKNQWTANGVKKLKLTQSAASKTTGTAVKTAANSVKKTTEVTVNAAVKTAGAVTKTTASVASGAATFGVTTVISAAVDTAKMAAKAAAKVSTKMQQQVNQSMAVQNEQAVQEVKTVSKEEGKKDDEQKSEIVLFLAAILVGLMIIFTGSTAAIQTIISSNQQEENSGVTCDQIVQAAQNELKDADSTVGGYRYKNWYGMDDNWCAMFVSYCADKCGFIEAGIMPKTASVAASKAWYQSHNLYHEASSGYIPKAGDIIIFGNGMSHTGIVTGYDPETKKLTTIEGNSGRSSTTPYHKGSRVKEHTYPITYAKIAGYGTPQYPQDNSENEITQQEHN